VKGFNIYMPPLTEQQWFTIQRGVLTGTSSRQRSAISSGLQPEWTDFGSTV